MRILHVMPHYYPAVRYGGPVRSVHGLAAATAALGHEVHVYTTNVDGSSISDVPTEVPVVRDGVSIWYFPAGLGRKVFRSPAMSRKLEKTIAAFDVVHIHYVWVWSTVAAAAAARRHNVPYLLAPRGMLVADLIKRRSALVKRVWLALFDRRTVAGAAAIHVTSVIEGNEFRALGLATPRVAIVANGIELPEDAGEAAKPLAQAILGKPPYVLFLGRISWKKGLDRLIGAMVGLPKAELVVAGYDEKGYQATVQRLAIENGVADRTHFIGPVEGADKWTLIRNAACLVLPSYNENFGMSVVEAMAVGCPVVVSAEVGLADVVSETGSGVVATGDCAALSKAINAVLSDPNRTRQMGEAGRRTVRERFGWPVIAREMVEVYRECKSSKIPGKVGRTENFSQLS